MSTYTLLVARSAGLERLVSAELVVASDFTASGTNYWEFALRVRRVKPDGTTRQSYGEIIGAIYSLSSRSLTAGLPVSLYSSTAGLPLNDGDELWATVTSSGSPAVLDNPSFILERQKVQ